MINSIHTIFILILSATIIVNCCEIGSWQRVDHEQNHVFYTCETCFRGYYCPGDNNYYPCPSGTISRDGQSKCTQCNQDEITDAAHTRCIKCPTIRMNRERTACLLPDTPSNAREAIDNVFSLKSNETSSYWFTTLTFHQNSVQYTFKNDIPESIVVFASTITGQPNKLNYDSMGTGQNVTLLIRGEFLQTKIVYFNIIRSNPTQNPPLLKGLQFGEFDIKQRFEIQSGFNNVSLNLGQEKEELIFEFNNNQNQKFTQLEIDVRMDSFGKSGFSLYYSHLSNIEYPNPNNANIAIQATPQKPSTVFKVPYRVGPYRFSVMTQLSFATTFQINVKTLN